MVRQNAFLKLTLETWGHLRREKKWWMAPLLFFFILLASLFAFALVMGPLAPFIYPLL